MSEETPARTPAPTSSRGRFGRRRRANVAGGRRHSHRVLVTPEEEARLVQLAEAHRVTVPRLLIEAALTLHASGTSGGSSGAGVAAAGGLGGVVTPTQRRDALVEMFAIRRLLAAVSNNVNQIARHANAGDEFPPDARVALQAVRRVVERLDEAMDRVAGA